MERDYAPVGDHGPERSDPAVPVQSLFGSAFRRSTAARRVLLAHVRRITTPMIRKLKSGEYRLYSRKVDPKTGKRRNLGTFKTRAAAEKHEKAVQFFKRRA
jgi:hypothetical protein